MKSSAFPKQAWKLAFFFILFVLVLPAAAYAAPTVLYTDITSGPKTGGEGNNGAYLSIFGKNFGSDISRVKVYVGSGEVARYMYLGASKGRPDIQQVSVQLGAAVTSGAIRVTVNGISSNTDHSFTVRSGNIYFVSLTGSDSTGAANNISRPYRTPNYVVRSLSAFAPGDFVVLRGGNYSINDGTNNIVAGSYLRANKSGTAAAPMTFMGYPGEAVNLTVTSQTEIFSHYEAISHWVVSGLNININHCQTYGVVLDIGLSAPSSAICSDTTNAVLGMAHSVKVVNIDINGNDVGGNCSGHDAPLMVGYSDNVKVYGVSIHDTSPALENSESAHQIYLNVRQNGTEVGWNAVYNIPATRAVIQVHQDNYGCYGTKAINNVKIHDNLLHDIAGQAILLDGATGDIDIYNNLIYNTPLPNDHRYSDILALRGSGGQLNARIFNNTIYANPKYTDAGYMIGMGAIASSYCPQRIELKNNIFYVLEGQDAYYSQTTPCSTNSYIVSDRNLWLGSNNPLPSFKGAGDKNADPLFVNIATKNFRLQSTSSPAYNTGADVSSVFNRDFEGNTWLGGVYDMGVYKFQPAAVLNPPQELRVR